MKKKIYAALLTIAVFTVCFGKIASAQTTCTSNDPLLCATATPDLNASFTAGNPVTNVLTSGLVFTAQAIGSPNELSLTSRLYTVNPGSAGCVIVRFAQAGTATITSTDVNII